MVTSVNDRLNSSPSLGIKAPCRIATTANITLAGLQTIGGVSVIDGDRVLVKNQTNAVENGIYLARANVWERARDFDGAWDAATGTIVRVYDGISTGSYVLTSSGDIGVAAQSFALDATAGASGSKGTVEVEAYRSGSMTDSEVIAAAVIASESLYGGDINLSFDGSRTYTVGSSIIDKTNTSFLLEGNGATIAFDSAALGAYPIRLINDFTDQLSVTTVTNSVSVNLSNGTGTVGYVTTQVAQLDIASGLSAWAENDVFKLISDDFVALSDTAENERNGEFMTVGAVVRTLAYDAQTANFTLYDTITGATSGATAVIHLDSDSGSTGTLSLKNISGAFADNEIITGALSGSATVNGVLSSGGIIYTRDVARYSHTSGVKIGKVQNDKTAIINDLTITKGENIPSTPGHFAITLFGVHRPVLTNVTVADWQSSGINFVGCYEPDTHFFHAHDLPTDTTSNIYGYGIVRSGCHNGRDIAPSGYNLRHLVTTNFLPTLAGDNKFAERGRTFGAKTIAGFAQNTTGAAFDFHPDADSCEYINCIADAPYVGMYGSDIGFQVRGINNKLRGCHAAGGLGYRVLVDDGKSPTTGWLIDGCSHECPAANTSVSRYAIHFTGVAANRCVGTLRNFFATKNNGGTDDYFFRFYYSDITVISPAFIASMAGTSPQLFSLSNSTVLWRGGLIDLSGSTGSTHVLFETDNAACVLDCDNLEVRAGAVSWLALASHKSTAAETHFTNFKYDNFCTDGDGFQLLATGSKISLTTQEPVNSSMMAKVEDDFIGFSVDPVKWTLRKGSDGGLIDYAKTTERCGAVMATNTGAGDSMATSGTQIVSPAMFTCENGRLIFEASVKVGSVVNVALFIGLTDNDASLEMPFTLAAGNILTSNATDAVGFLFDTAADTDSFWLVGVKADVDATKQNIAAVPNTGAYRQYRIVVERDGSATFYIQRAKVGTAMLNAVTASALLCGTVASYAHTNATKTVYLDRLMVAQQR